MADDPWTQGRLFYLVLLLLGVAGAFLIGGRQRLSRSLRDLAVWALIFAMVIIAYGFRDTLRSALFTGTAMQVSEEAVELHRGADGHFHALLSVNDRPIRFIIDTGASDIVLSRADAAAVGIDLGRLDFSGRAQTANGPVPTAPVRLAVVRLGDFTDRDLPARVNGGELGGSLLGMTYLDLFSQIEISGDRMRLHR